MFLSLWACKRDLAHKLCGQYSLIVDLSESETCEPVSDGTKRPRLSGQYRCRHIGVWDGTYKLTGSSALNQASAQRIGAGRRPIRRAGRDDE
jgi:hypothetical protein